MKNVYFYHEDNEASLYHFDDSEANYEDYFKDIFENKINLFDVDFIRIESQIYMDRKIEISNKMLIENHDILDNSEILIDHRGYFIFSFPNFSGLYNALNLTELYLYEDDSTYEENKTILSIKFKLELV